MFRQVWMTGGSEFRLVYTRIFDRSLNFIRNPRVNARPHMEGALRCLPVKLGESCISCCFCVAACFRQDGLFGCRSQSCPLQGLYWKHGLCRYLSSTRIGQRTSNHNCMLWHFFTWIPIFRTSTHNMCSSYPRPHTIPIFLGISAYERVGPWRIQCEICRHFEGARCCHTHSMGIWGSENGGNGTIEGHILGWIFPYTGLT